MSRWPRSSVVLLTVFLAGTPAHGQVAGVAGTELVVPIVAKSGGANGASYASDVIVSSDAAPPVDLVFVLHPRGGETLEAHRAAASLPLKLSLAELFPGLAGGAGWLRVDAGAPVRVTSTTAGAEFHAVPRSVALLAGESTVLPGAMAGFGPDPRARYNFGGAEVGGRPATVRACVRGVYSRGWGPNRDTGPFVACADFPLAPHGSFQVSMFSGLSLPPREIVTSAEVLLTVTDGTGSVVAWGTAVDAGNAATAFEMSPGAGLGPALGPSPGRLVLTKAGSGRGAVALRDGSSLCGAACDSVVVLLPEGPAAELRADPAADSVLASWQGCDAADGPACGLAEPLGRRVTVTFDLSRLTVDVSGFLDASVTAGGRSFACAGPSRRCLFPIPPGAPVNVGAVAWPGVPANESVAFVGPGCGKDGCSLTVARDPTVAAVRLTQPGSSRIDYFGAYPPSLEPGEAAQLLVRASGCNLDQFLEPSAGATLEAPGLYRVSPQQTTTYTLYCYYRLPGSQVTELEKRSATVTIQGP